MALDRSRSRCRRGVSLIEALVALLVMSLGMLALAGVQANLRANSDVARQRAEATRIASEEMERLRFFTTVEASPGKVAWDNIASRTVDSYRFLDDAGNKAFNTTFKVERKVTKLTSPGRLHAQVDVTWKDRDDVTQLVSLDTVVAALDPSYGGLLMTPATTPAFAKRSGRNTTIPPEAKDLGSVSAFKPPSSTGVFWIFNNATGAIVQVCSNLDRALSNVTADDVANCDSVSGQLLAGNVRFNMRSAATDVGSGRGAYKPIDDGSALWVIDTSADTHVLVRVCTGVSTSNADLRYRDTECRDGITVSRSLAPALSTGSLSSSDARDPTWPSLNLSVGMVFDARSTSDLPRNLLQNGEGAAVAPSCYSDAPSTALAAATQPVVRYYCLVRAKDSKGWGGLFTLQPRPFTDAGSPSWRIAGESPQYKVCRYTTADSDRAANLDHPRTYCLVNTAMANNSTCVEDRNNGGKTSLVTGNLINQNFLVIPASASCPADTATVSPASGILVNVNTRQHQP